MEILTFKDLKPMQCNYEDLRGLDLESDFIASGLRLLKKRMVKRNDYRRRMLDDGFYQLSDERRAFVEQRYQDQERKIALLDDLIKEFE